MQLFLAAGGPACCWQSYAADPLELGTPWGLGLVAGLLEIQEAPPQGSPTQKYCLRSFPDSARLVAAFLGCRGSSRGLVVLSSYSVGVGHPLGAWAGSRAAGNSRGSSPGQPDSEKPSELFSRLGQACCSFSGLQGVLQGAGGAEELFHGSGAPRRGLCV